MKKEKFIIRIVYDTGKESVQTFFTRKGADDEYKRLTQPKYKIYDGVKYTSDFIVKRK